MNWTRTSEAKRELRRRIIAARAALSPAEREERSRDAALRIVGLEAFRSARTVALYAPLGAEVATAEIARRAEADGKRVAWPRLAGAALAMEFAACPAAALVPGPLGALEPPASAPAVRLEETDLVVVPGVAFDARGRRLGRGRGFYDATLAALPRGTARVGLAFEMQLVPEVPAEAHDAPLDAVVTERRVLAASVAGAAPEHHPSR